MKKFILLYSGPFDPNNPSLTQASLDQWAGQIGGALVDKGTLFGPKPRAVIASGPAIDSPSTLRGYSVIQAEDMSQATQIIGNHPFLANRDSEIDVFELLTGDVTADMLTTVSTVTFPQQPVSTPTSGTVTPTMPAGLTQPSTQTLPPSQPTQSSAPPAQTPGELTIPHEEEETIEPKQPPTPTPPAD